MNQRASKDRTRIAAPCGALPPARRPHPRRPHDMAGLPCESGGMPSPRLIIQI